jgi:hypothetical protein
LWNCQGHKLGKTQIYSEFKIFPDILKVSLSQNYFKFDLNLQKWVSNPDPEHYAPKEKMLRVVIWHPLWRFGAKSKDLPEIKLPLVSTGTKQTQYELYSSIQPYDLSNPGRC